MRLLVASVILILAAVAIYVGLVNRPLESPLLIDAQSPGAWPDYAAYTGSDQQLVCMYVYLPGQGSKRPIAKT